MRKRITVFTGLVMLGLLLLASEAEEEAPKRHSVGVARVDITPDYPVRLNGFGFRREESEGINQRIFAKALAFGETDPAVLITVDSLGIPLSMTDEVAERLSRRSNVKREKLVITFSHSHTTPKVNGASDTIFSVPIPPEHQKNIDRYTTQLTQWLEDVAVAALADRKPGQLSWAVGEVGFAKNRRTEGGPVDHDLPMLVVKDEKEGVRAIYVSYACHCVTLSHNLIGGDWAGHAQEAVEKAFPGATCLVSIGCGSDSNPSARGTADDVATAADQGAQILAEVKRLHESPTKPISGTVDAVYKTIDLPLQTLPSREEWEKIAAEEGPAGYSARWHLEKLDRGEELMTAIEYPIQTWKFGNDLAMLFLGGEVCVDYSLRLKQELGADHLWINAYSNAFCSYIPSERLLSEGGYGGGAEMVYFGVPTLLKPGLEDLIVTEVHRQINSQ